MPLLPCHKWYLKRIAQFSLVTALFWVCQATLSKASSFCSTSHLTWQSLVVVKVLFPLTFTGNLQWPHSIFQNDKSCSVKPILFIFFLSTMQSFLQHLMYLFLVAASRQVRTQISGWVFSFSLKEKYQNTMLECTFQACQSTAELT